VPAVPELREAVEQHQQLPVFGSGLDDVEPDVADIDHPRFPRHLLGNLVRWHGLVERLDPEESGAGRLFSAARRSTRRSYVPYRSASAK